MAFKPVLTDASCVFNIASFGEIGENRVLHVLSCAILPAFVNETFMTLVSHLYFLCRFYRLDMNHWHLKLMFHGSVVKQHCIILTFSDTVSNNMYTN